MYLSVLVMTHRRYTMVNVTGDVNFHSSRWLQEHLLRFLLRGGTQLVVNLSRVTFIDCRGLRTLLLTCRKAEEWACSIRFSELSSPVQRVAELTGQRGSSLPQMNRPAQPFPQARGAASFMLPPGPGRSAWGC